MEAEADIIDVMLRRYGLRIGPAMGKYLLSQLDRARLGQVDDAVPVIGGDARTGVPQRRLIPMHELLAATRPAAQQGELFA